MGIKVNFYLETGNPSFNPNEPVVVNGFRYIPAAEHERRVTELLEANNRELERRRAAEQAGGGR